MDSQSFRVDSRMVPSVCLTMFAGAALIVFEGASQQGLLMMIVLSPFFYLGAEILARAVRIDEHGIAISKLLRSVHLDWEEIQWLDAVRTGRKVFLIIHSRDARPAFLTNTLAGFADLAGRIIERLPRDIVSERAETLLTEPPSKVGPLVQAWIACVVITGVLAGRLLGYG